MEINILQDEIIEEFETFDEWMDKYNYLIELSNSLPIISEDGKSQANLIEGCQSRVWLDAVLNDKNNVIYTADSDAIITKGIRAANSLLFRSGKFLFFSFVICPKKDILYNLSI